MQITRKSSLVCVTAAFAAASLVATPAAAAKATFHTAESCTGAAWGYLRAIDDEWGTINTCRYAVEVWFMTKSGTTVRGTVQPGSAFRTGLRLSAFNHSTDGWIATTCRTGTVPHPDVSDANWDTILASQYDCKKP